MIIALDAIVCPDALAVRCVSGVVGGLALSIAAGRHAACGVTPRLPNLTLWIPRHRVNDHLNRFYKRRTFTAIINIMQYLARDLHFSVRSRRSVIAKETWGWWIGFRKMSLLINVTPSF